MVNVPENVKKQIIRLCIEQGRTMKSVADEFGLSPNVVSRIIRNYRKECHDKAAEKDNLRLMRENKILRDKNTELEKENDFLKKAAAFFAKETH